MLYSIVMLKQGMSAVNSRQVHIQIWNSTREIKNSENIKGHIKKKKTYGIGVYMQKGIISILIWPTWISDQMDHLVKGSINLKILIATSYCMSYTFIWTNLSFLLLTIFVYGNMVLKLIKMNLNCMEIHNKYEYIQCVAVSLITFSIWK